MSRKVFDILASSAGVVVVVVLVIAGGLLTWGHSFVNDNVHSQLAQQQVYFPPKAAFDHPKAGTEITPSMIPSVSKYAGQQLLTGEQAKTYADNFIAVHLSEMPYGGVYSKVSAASLASSDQHQAADRGADGVPRHDPARAAARGLRVLGRRHDHAVGRDRIVHRSDLPVGARRPWLLARPSYLGGSSGPRSRKQSPLRPDGRPDNTGPKTKRPRRFAGGGVARSVGQ